MMLLDFVSFNFGVLGCGVSLGVLVLVLRLVFLYD